MTAAPPLDERPVTSLRGVGPALAATLERLGLHTVQDLLFLLPLRYEDRTRVVPIGTLRAGDRAVDRGRGRSSPRSCFAGAARCSAASPTAPAS